MKAIMVMFDSLRLDLLPSYGGRQISLPNFDRLAQRTVQFQNSYACSLPCMPARRELHTGRPNFLHRSWGPIEPFDDSMPELLKQNGVYSHLVTDHYHYFEDGGCTYHNRYSSWDMNRGQEGDFWQGSAEPRETMSPHLFPDMASRVPPDFAKNLTKISCQDVINRREIKGMEDFPMWRTFDGGLKFIERNKDFDNWYLQLETFDPHEPFNAPIEYARLLLDPDSMSLVDWPPYAPVHESEEQIKEMRSKYLALLAFCDYQLGRLLDAMDHFDLWSDTMLIVNTDHGYMLSEHQWWGKMVMPDYNEVVHTPLFIWDPGAGMKGKTRESLVQTIDLAPTLLDYFNIPIPVDMLGKSLRATIRDDRPVREYGIFGCHGSTVNITDGTYVYMKAPVDYSLDLNEYTLMPTHMMECFSTEELSRAEISEGFKFTKNCPVLKIPAKGGARKLAEGESLLFDVKSDPGQNHPLTDEVIEKRMRQALMEQFKENEAPEELYRRFGL